MNTNINPWLSEASRIYELFDRRVARRNALSSEYTEREPDEEGIRRFRDELHFAQSVLTPTIKTRPSKNVANHIRPIMFTSNENDSVFLDVSWDDLCAAVIAIAANLPLGFTPPVNYVWWKDALVGWFAMHYRWPAHDPKWLDNEGLLAEQIGLRISQTVDRYNGEKKYSISALKKLDLWRFTAGYARVKELKASWINADGKRRSRQMSRWFSLRYKVLKKSDGRCCLCGRSALDGVQLHVDHIIPRSKRPDLEFEIDNLQVLCADCNMGKSDKDDTDWRKPRIPVRTC